MKEQRDRLPGPGSVRVGRFIGRLGVVSLPAVELGLGLESRVVRRHVARLESVGWLGRAAGFWGEGSVVWLTRPGLSGVGLGGLAPVRASPAPSPTLTAHLTVVAWSAVRAERRGHPWHSARELATERERWEIRVRDERGRRRSVLPDLAVWLKAGGPPIAVVIELGYRRADRQEAILDGWRAAIYAGQYSGVRYDCNGEQAAQRMARLGVKVRLESSVFLAVAQTSPEEIAAITPAAVDEAPQLPAASAEEGIEADEQPDRERSDEVPVREPERPAQPPPATITQPSDAPETPQSAAEREERYRRILGIAEPRPRRRWRC